MKKTILIYSLLIFAIAIMLTLTRSHDTLLATSFDWVIPLVAVLFFGLGYMLTKNQKQSLDKPVRIQAAVSNSDLSHREYEVLREIANGLSNKEIANKLFLSESTIKTHVSSLLVKLNAKRRTQAVTISRDLNLLP